MTLMKMFESHRSTTDYWSPASDSDGEPDNRETVIKTLIEEHIGGCEKCFNMIQSNSILSRKINTTNTNVSFLKNQVRALTDHIFELKEQVSNIDTNIEDHVEYLEEVPKPQIYKQNSYDMVTGHKIIDTNLMSMALKNAQACKHGALIIAENSSDSVKVDFATQLAFVCTTCGAQTMFTTSRFSLKEPKNYSINKKVIGKIGKSAYKSLVSAFASDPGTKMPIKFRVKDMLRTKMIISYENQGMESGKPIPNKTEKEDSDPDDPDYEVNQEINFRKFRKIEPKPKEPVVTEEKTIKKVRKYETKAKNQSKAVEHNYFKPSTEAEDNAMKLIQPYSRYKL